MLFSGYCKNVSVACVRKKLNAILVAIWGSVVVVDLTEEDVILYADERIRMYAVNCMST